jgi:hypothetical protein
MDNKKEYKKKNTEKPTTASHGGWAISPRCDEEEREGQRRGVMEWRLIGRCHRVKPWVDNHRRMTNQRRQ